MGAIPDSSLPGHRLLHERTKIALDRCQETEDVDFKESAEWDSLKWRITHAALGMGNLRDGGIVVIGVSERGSMWELTGIEARHLATYDPDKIGAHLNGYISPFAEIDVVLVKHDDGLPYLSIFIREFRDTPLVCKKEGPKGTKIKTAGVYVRLSGPARTTIVTDARQLHELLELAAEKRARRIIEAGQRVGMTIPPTSLHFDKELDGL